MNNLDFQSKSEFQYGDYEVYNDSDEDDYEDEEEDDNMQDLKQGKWNEFKESIVQEHERLTKKDGQKEMNAVVDMYKK